MTRPEAHPPRLRQLVAAFPPVVLVVLVAGCASRQGATSADCAAAIRRDGTVFVEAGRTRQSAVSAGRAERAECHDVGRDAPGAVFPADATTVPVVAFPGHDPSEVIGVRESKSIRVFVAEGLRAEQVLSTLSEDAGISG